MHAIICFPIKNWRSYSLLTFLNVLAVELTSLGYVLIGILLFILLFWGGINMHQCKTSTLLHY